MPGTPHPAPAPPTPDRPVLVVGAGLAGLACTLDLLRAGLPVRLLEASDEVGGRMRADHRDGYTLDRGFQVLNTSYPQVKRRIRLAPLRPRPFTPGALVHTPTGPLRLTDPTRLPGPALRLLTDPTLPTTGLAALGLLSALDLLAPPRLRARTPETTTREALRRARVPDRLVDTFLRPFLAGVFLDDSLETSSRVFHLVWRSFLRGSLTLPAAGIGAVPRQLADDLPDGVLRRDTPVAALTPDGLRLADGTELPAAAVVVATDPAAAHVLLPELPPVPTRTTTTYHHAAAHRPPLREPTLLLDSELRLLNTCVITEVAPGHAPPGRSLIATSVLGPDRPGRERALRAVLAEVHGADTDRWDLVNTVTVPAALPAMPPPWPLSRTTRHAPGRYVCGDHRATGSVQGALASGTRAARELLADLAP
ncbi:NAD(P)/FAD-dependent oxidoreductase [Streptomyces sp. BI20]|uniref:NAD(P)/FAD-dependent oxidoreductase n=1 Tax=Streptomyces sp. BI20 TaxID=3403460 RepID=UPI003C76BF2B